MDNTYLKALENARKELAGLMQQRAEMDDRIARLAKSIEGLTALCDDQDHSAELKTKLAELELSEAMGFTTAIRHILGASMWPISATEIRDALVEEGFDPQKYSNMLTVIHNTLLRLEKQGEVGRGTNILMGNKRGWVLRQQTKK